MKKNSTLQKKIKSYSAVAGAVTAATAVTNEAHAQIIYTDITPDAVVSTTGTKFDIDLNGDATVDFSVAFTSGTYSSLPYNYCLAYTTLGTTNQIDSSASNGYAEVHALNNNINSSNLWNIGFAGTGVNQHLLGLTLGPYTIGNWLGVTDQYLAVKFDIGGTNHYGWIRMDVSATANSITVKDMAYDAGNDVGILAGAMPLGVAKIELEGVKVFNNGKQININIGSIEAANVVVRDLTGREVYSSNLNNTFSQINMENTADGIYTVTVTANSKVTTKKISLR